MTKNAPFPLPLGNPMPVSGPLSFEIINVEERNNLKKRKKRPYFFIIIPKHFIIAGYGR